MHEGKEPGEASLRDEFNVWAELGRGEEMERHHISIAEQTIRAMDLHPGERVLDLGCGSGWATRLMARQVAGGPHGRGQVVGLDIADGMIRHARSQSRDIENAMFVWSSASEIPFEDNYFHKVLSIESFYYFPDQERVLQELLRVTCPGGRVYILINLYRDNPLSLEWVHELKIPVHARSSSEYLAMLGGQGFVELKASRVPDFTPTSDDYTGRWFKNADEVREFKRLGALLLIAQKPLASR